MTTQQIIRIHSLFFDGTNFDLDVSLEKLVSGQDKKIIPDDVSNAASSSQKPEDYAADASKQSIQKSPSSPTSNNNSKTIYQKPKEDIIVDCFKRIIEGKYYKRDTWLFPQNPDVEKSWYGQKVFGDEIFGPILPWYKSFSRQNFEEKVISADDLGDILKKLNGTISQQEAKDVVSYMIDRELYGGEKHRFRVKTDDATQTQYRVVRWKYTPSFD